MNHTTTEGKVYITSLDNHNTISNTEGKSMITIEKTNSNFNLNNTTHLKHNEDNEAHNSNDKEQLEEQQHSRPPNETFLNFFIEKETSFADFDKIASHYESIAVSKYNRYNANITLLSSKHKEYNSLLLSIKSELLSFLHLTQNNFDCYYNITLLTFSSLISQKEHEVICYNNIYKRLYKSNYLIKKRLEQEMKYEQLNDAHCEKYSILKNHALLTVTKQTQMLNNVHSFQEMAKEKYSDTIKQKTMKYNQIDFQVLMIKKDTKDIEKKLQAYKDRQLNKRLEIKRRNALNGKYKVDNASLAKDYIKQRKKLIEIYDMLKVKGLDDIIERFNYQRKVYQCLNTQFADANKEIAATNIELTTLTKRLQKINMSILMKNRRIPIEYIDDKINRLNRRYAEVFSSNEHLAIEIQRRVNKMKLLIVFIANFNKKMYDSMMIPAMYYGFTVIDYMKAYSKYFTYKGNELYFNYITVNGNVNGDNDLKIIDYAQLCLKLFNDFSTYSYLIFSNAFNTVFTEQLALALNSEYEVIAFSDKSILVTYEDYLRIANTDWDKKEKIYKRGEKDILPEEKTNETQRKNKQKKGEVIITKEQLYLSYVKFLKDKKSNSNYIQRHPRRSIVLMNKYANELVESNKRHNKTKNNGNGNGSNNNLLTYTRLLTTIENTKRKDSESTNNNINTSLNEDYDSYTSTPKRRNKSTRNKEDYKLKGITAYPEMDKIYSRLNDLRTLELHYFKAKDKHLVSNTNFNEIYYTFKRKFMKEKERKKNNQHQHQQHKRVESLSINVNKLPQVSISISMSKGDGCNTSRTQKKTSLSINKMKSNYNNNNKKYTHNMTKQNYRANTCTTEYLSTLTLRNNYM